jgi:hypothetical protein
MTDKIKAIVSYILEHKEEDVKDCQSLGTWHTAYYIRRRAIIANHPVGAFDEWDFRHALAHVMKDVPMSMDTILFYMGNLPCKEIAEHIHRIQKDWCLWGKFTGEDWHKFIHQITVEMAATHLVNEKGEQGTDAQSEEIEWLRHLTTAELINILGYEINMLPFNEEAYYGNQCA